MLNAVRKAIKEKLNLRLRSYRQSQKNQDLFHIMIKIGLNKYVLVELY